MAGNGGVEQDDGGVQSEEPAEIGKLWLAGWLAGSVRHVWRDGCLGSDPVGNVSRGEGT